MSPSKWFRTSHDGTCWRFALVLIAASLLLLLQTPAAFAQSMAQAPSGGADGPVEATALDVLCVEGLVINHEERPLRGWTVTATFAENPAAYEPLTSESRGNGRFRFELPEPGLWSFAIDLPQDWRAVTDPSFVVNVTYGSKECVDIRFKVEQVITVIVLKIDDDHTPLAGWTITATPGPENRFAEEQTATTDEQGVATFELSPGAWTFTEQAPDDVEWWAPVMPPDGTQELVVTAPGPHMIRFKNLVKRGKGCIEVIKRDVPPDAEAKGGQVGQGEPFGLPDWPIEVYRANGSLAAEGETDAFGRITFTDLPFGPYTVREVVLPGWEPASPTAYEVFLTRADDSCQLIEFYNRQVEKGFCIAGFKLDENGLYGIPGWEIDASPVDAGGVDPAPVTTDGQGKFRIDLPLDDYRVPGSTYEVCEEVRQGWTSAGPTCFTVTLPEHEGVCVYTPEFINRQTQHEKPAGKDSPQPERPAGKDRYQPDRSGPPGTCRAYHVVKRGEGLYSIAPQYGTTGQALLRANPWVRKQRNLWLYVGQKVCIP